MDKSADRRGDGEALEVNQFAKHIARAIVRNQSRKRWSGLHTDAVSAVEKEIIMSVDRDLQHPASDQQIAEEKQRAHESLAARVAELEQRVAALEGK